MLGRWLLLLPQRSKAQNSFLEVLPATLKTTVFQLSSRAWRHQALAVTPGNPVFRLLNIPTGFGIVRQQIDPALLEWSGANTFKARVFPIEPQGLKRMVLVYEHTLPRDGDHLRYLFPFPGLESLAQVEAQVHLRDAARLRVDLPPAEDVLRTPTGKPVQVRLQLRVERNAGGLG